MSTIRSSTPIDIVINGNTVFTANSDSIIITGSLVSTTPVATASYATTASYALNAGASINTGSFATTGSNIFNGNQTITGSLNIIFTSGSSPQNLISVASQSITRFTLSNFGAASFTLNSSAVEAGNVNISTPSGFPGLQFFTSGSLNRFDAFNSGSLFVLGYRLINTYGTLAIFNTSHNVSIGYHASGSGFSSIPIDSGYKLLVSSSGVSGSFNANNVLLVSGSNVNINGNLIVSGSTTIGDATTDTITMTAATMSLGSGIGILNIDSNTFVVDGTNNRVGIGVVSPLYTLQVSGNLFLGDNTRGYIVSDVASGGNVTTKTVVSRSLYSQEFGVYSGSTYRDLIPGTAFVAAPNSTQFAFNATGTTIPITFNTDDWNERMRVSGNGNILIGTKTDSGFKLDVSGSGASGSVRISGNTVISGSFTFAAPTSPAFNGEIVRFGAGTLTTGQLYFLSSSGTWSLANANSTGSSTGMLGLAVGSSPTTNGLLIRGFAASSSYTYGTGSVVYMATGSGIMTATSPSSSNHVVRVMGYQTTLANTIYFDPDKTWVTLA